MVDPVLIRERLQAFQTANQNLSLQPLLKAEDLNRLRVEYEPQTLDDLEQAVYGSADTEKILFTGHTGCGKSTLLAELRDRLSIDFFVVFFSISDLVDTADLNHINILFTMATQLMESAENQQVVITPSIKRKFYQWFGEQTSTETTQIEAALETGYEAGGGLDLAAIVAKFWVSVKGVLKANSVIRNEIKTKFERQISELIDRINEIAIVIQNAVNRPILVIIDDLDKLNPALTEQIYRNNSQPLFQPQFRIVYTFPIFVLREVTLRSLLRQNTDKMFTMRVAKFFTQAMVHQPDAKPDPELIQAFTEMLKRRLINPDLIEPEVMPQIILKSGGVLREAVRIASRCCAKCAQQLRTAIRQTSGQTASQAETSDLPGWRISLATLQAVLEDLQVEFGEPLGQLDYALLKSIYQTLQPQDAEDQRFLDLLHGLYILEYRNSVPWYDLHPIVLGLLQQQGSLGESP